MKSIKTFAIRFPLLPLLICLIGCGRVEHVSIYDFPNSVWKCDDREMVIKVGDEYGDSKTKYEKNGLQVYLKCSLDNIREVASFFTITEDEYNGSIKPIDVAKQRVLSGTFVCSKNELIITSKKGFYDADFWGTAELDIIRLRFYRVA